MQPSDGDVVWPTALIRQSFEIGLLPRMGDVPKGLFGPSDSLDSTSWGGAPKGRGLAMLIATRQQQLLWNLNRLPSIEPQERPAFLGRTMGAHRRRAVDWSVEDDVRA